MTDTFGAEYDDGVDDVDRRLAELERENAALRAEKMGWLATGGSVGSPAPLPPVNAAEVASRPHREAAKAAETEREFWDHAEAAKAASHAVTSPKVEERPL